MQAGLNAEQDEVSLMTLYANNLTLNIVNDEAAHSTTSPTILWDSLD